jgi:diacylglycerol kinase (ATP)
MKHVFIVNPHSGKQELKKDLFEQLKNYNGKIECEVVKFKDREETINFIKEYCSKSEDDIVFCACGGDGTINAVVNAVMGFKNAIVTCYPCGSGNDFVKLYGGKEKFLNLDNLINGVETKIDVMKVNDMYAVNVTNFGFDAAVCDIANKVRRKKIIGGKRSYTTGIIVSLFKSMKTKCQVIVDEEVISNKHILLSTVANGKYVGGAYNCAPKSNNEDGLLEVSVIKPVSLFKFISLIKPYKEGKQLDNPKFEKYITYRQAKKVVIESDENFKICLDGEIYKGEYFEIENMKQALRFIKPKE